MSAIFLAESSCKRQLKRYIDFMSSNPAIGRIALGDCPDPGASSLCARVAPSESANPFDSENRWWCKELRNTNCNFRRSLHLVAPNSGKMA
jgi:hypothetical protein